MTARSQCDHWDCPVVSDFKAWLFLSLPQNASLSPWETLDFQVFSCVSDLRGKMG